MPGLGEEFRAAREARRLSLSDVSEQIHIRTVYLQCLEDEDWKSIAAPVYVRGFIRTYARFLGLSGEHAVAVFNESIGEQAKADEAVVVAPARRKPSIWLWVAGVAALVLVGFVAYSYYEFQQTGGSQVATVSPTDTPEPAASDLAATGGTAKIPVAKHVKGNGKQTLEVKVTQASWLLVKIDGTQALEGIFPPGTTKQFHGKQAIIRAGNAGGVDLTVNGRAIGAMGPSGAVVDRTIGLVEE